MNNQDMIEALSASLHKADWNTWSKGFIESIQNRLFDDLSNKQQVKVVELYEDLQQIHLPMLYAMEENDG